MLIPRGHQFCSSIEAMADSVIGQLPERFHLVAWSMGGYIAFNMLPRIMERLISLVLVATSARPENPDDTQRRLDLIARAERDGIASAHIKSIAHSCRDIATVDPAAREAMLQSAIELGAGAYRLQQHAIINRADGRSNLGLVRCPTLVMVGDSDTVTPPECALEICDLMDQAEFRLIPGCGHCPPLEHPGYFNSLLDAWLSRNAARADLSGEPAV